MLVVPPVVVHVTRMLLPSFAIAVTRRSVTRTVVEAGSDVHPLVSVTVTLYAPLAADVTFTIDGFWFVDAKPLGPVQLYVVPETVLAVRFNVLPASSGPLLPAVGALGVGLMVTVALPDAVPEQLASSTSDTVYTVVEPGLTRRVAGLEVTLFW